MSRRLHGPPPEDPCRLKKRFLQENATTLPEKLVCFGDWIVRSVPAVIDAVASGQVVDAPPLAAVTVHVARAAPVVHVDELGDAVTGNKVYVVAVSP